jgi:hypothetical protein
MRKDLGPEHIKYLLLQPRQKLERDYHDHMRRARVYRWQAESLFVQARNWHEGAEQKGLFQSAHLALGFAKDEINQAKALRG